MFKIEIFFKGTMSEVNPILCTDNIVVSGEIELPFVIESDNNQSIIIIGKANSYDSDWVDINTALKRLLRNEAQETDFYGDFICLKLSEIMSIFIRILLVNSLFIMQ